MADEKFVETPEGQPCPKCGGTKRESNYGFAYGPLGIYTCCTTCDKLLQFSADEEGTEECSTE